MKLYPAFDDRSLTALGADAVALLCRGDIGSLAQKYGYALSHGRDAASAIREDVDRSLSQLRAASLAPAPENPVKAVTFYQPNTSNLVALVECLAPTDTGAALLVELVVTRSGAEAHITLEEVSAYDVSE